MPVKGDDCLEGIQKMGRAGGRGTDKSDVKNTTIYIQKITHLPFKQIVSGAVKKKP